MIKKNKQKKKQQQPTNSSLSHDIIFGPLKEIRVVESIRG